MSQSNANLNTPRGLDLDAAGVISTVAGNGTPGSAGDGGIAIGANLNIPFGVAVDGAGNMYVADQNNQRIRKISQSFPGAPVIGTAVAGSAQATPTTRTLAP